MKTLFRVAVAMCLVTTNASAGDAVSPVPIPPDQCMSQCELAGTCDQLAFEAYPDFEMTVTEFASSCPAKYLSVVQGVCADGRRLLSMGTGFTSEIRFYSASGEFEGLITQTDTSVAPCMGQSFWPQYLQCETPLVVANLCGIGGEPGSPAFVNRWDQ